MAREIALIYFTVQSAISFTFTCVAWFQHKDHAAIGWSILFFTCNMICVFLSKSIQRSMKASNGV